MTGDILLLGHLSHIAHAWKLVHKTGHATHIIHLLQLVTKVFQIETFALGNLLRELFGFLFINLALDIFDQRHHIAHAENTRGDTLRMERL